MRHSRKKTQQIKADTDQMPLPATPIESVGKCQVNEKNEDIDK